MSSHIHTHIFASSLALSAVFVLSSCHSREKLSDQLQGRWMSAPSALANTGATEATLTRVMEYHEGDVGSEIDGNVTLTAMITVENTMPFNDALVTPLTITATGTASITGIYQVMDHDNVSLSLDATSMTIWVDPKGVQLDYDLVTAGSAAMVESLKTNALRLAKQQILRASHNLFYRLKAVDDIKIHGDDLTCEIAKNRLTFHRQP